MFLKVTATLTADAAALRAALASDPAARAAVRDEVLTTGWCSAADVAAQLAVDLTIFGARAMDLLSSSSSPSLLHPDVARADPEDTVVAVALFADDAEVVQQVIGAHWEAAHDPAATVELYFDLEDRCCEGIEPDQLLRHAGWPGTLQAEFTASEDRP